MNTTFPTASADQRIDKLLPRTVCKALPPLDATNGEPDPIVVAKFFTPDGGWTWYAIEFDGHDTFYGLEKELGYFSLSELLEIRRKLGLRVERDRHFKATRLSALGIRT